MKIHFDFGVALYYVRVPCFYHSKVINSFTSVKLLFHVNTILTIERKANIVSKPLKFCKFLKMYANKILLV